VLGTVPDNVPRTFDALKKAGIPIFAYGNFITISINFILLAFVIFQMVKIVNKIRLQDEEPRPTERTPEDIILLREIRDELKVKKITS
jgi:large conductance mechanosensitive channel